MRLAGRKILHDLGNAIADVERAYVSTKNTLNRFRSAQKAVETIGATEEDKRFDIDRYLDAQRRQVEAEVQFCRARAEYAVSLKNVHFEKGTLMHLSQIRFVAPQKPNEFPVQVMSDEMTNGT